MSYIQLGETNISVSDICSVSGAGSPTNISISNLNTRYIGDAASTGRGNVSQSKISLWYEQQCILSKGSAGGAFTPPIRTTRSSPQLNGWVYNGVQTPWRPSSFSDFKNAADVRPKATIVKIGTGDPNTFNLEVTCSHQDQMGGVAALPVGVSPIFYVYLRGGNISIGQWMPTNGSSIITYTGLMSGSYTLAVQDSLGAGNQFELEFSFTYPPL